LAENGFLVRQSPRRFDVCVVGSGPAGGFAAKALAEDEYRGHTYLADFPGCTHEKHKS
jgi:succinate dehydrogenase/fumarate reductase flavoprotein subunit